jgi:hypothetical protein
MKSCQSLINAAINICGRGMRLIRVQALFQRVTQILILRPLRQG